MTEMPTRAGVLMKVSQTIEFEAFDLINPNQRSTLGEYPINMAAHWGDVAAMSVLLAHGADINALGERDISPLMNAVYRNSLEAVAFILDHGGNINHLDERGGTAETIARQLDRLDIADLLARDRIMKGSTMPASYEWTREDEGFGVYCLYVGVGVGADSVMAAFGIVPDSEQLATAAQMLNFPGLGDGGNDCVQIGQIGDAIIAYEHNGWTGIDADVIKKIAAPISVSLYRNVNAVTQFVYAKHGEIIRTFDPVLYDPEGAIPEETALNFTPVSDSPYSGEGNEARAFQLMETLTGVRIERDWMLDLARPTFLRP